MKKNQLRKFVSLFDYVEKAGRVAHGEHYKDTDGNSFYYPMSDAAERLKQILFPDYPTYFHNEQDSVFPEGALNFMNDLMNEIEKNLYKYPQSKDIYVGDIIRLLYPLAPYLDTETKSVINEDGTVSSPDYPDYTEYQYAASKFLRWDYSEYYPNWDFTVFERYLAQCKILMTDFAKRLDKLCLTHSIDIIKIQQELGIFFLQEKRFR